MQVVGVGEIPFRHQAMSGGIHQHPRYHMSSSLVSLIIVNSARSSLLDLPVTWRVLRVLCATKEEEKLLETQVEPETPISLTCLVEYIWYTLGDTPVHTYPKHGKKKQKQV